MCDSIDVVPRCLHHVAALLALSSGCATTAPSVSAETTGLSPEEGIVIGKFGVPPAREVGPLSREVKIRRLADGRQWKLPFGDSEDGGRTAPFFVRLPAGRYAITYWSLVFLNSDEYQESPGVEFDVGPGGVTCVGSLYVVRLSGRFGTAPSGAYIHISVLPHDECQAMEPAFHQRAPNVRSPVQVRLATNLGCPSCRADLEPAARAVLAGPHDPGDLPVLIAERQRLTGDSRLSLQWPPDLALAQRSIRLKVCVSAEGKVQAVTVLESAHAELDRQVIDSVKAWRYQPYLVDDRPAGFCYRPRLELQPP